MFWWGVSEPIATDRQENRHGQYDARIGRANDLPNNVSATFAGSSFSDYVFFGGLLVDRTTVDIGPDGTYLPVY